MVRAGFRVSPDSPCGMEPLGIAGPSPWHAGRLVAADLVRARSRVSPAPPDRDGALQRRARLPRDLLGPRARFVRSAAPTLCRGRAPRLPEMRRVRAWLRARTLRCVRPRLARRILLQGPVRLPQLL